MKKPAPKPRAWDWHSVTALVRARFQRKQVTPEFANPYVVAEVPPSVFPLGKAQRTGKLAMDSFPGFSWGAAAIEQQTALFSVYDQQVNFIGYPTLAVLAQIPEYRNISETIATEMTRKWIRFHSRGDAQAEKEKLDEVKGAVEKADRENEGKPVGDRRPVSENDGVLKALTAYGEQRDKTDAGLPDEEQEEVAEKTNDLGVTEDPDEEITEELSDDLPGQEGPRLDDDGEPGGEGGDLEGEEKGGDKSDKIRELEEAFDKLGTRDIFTQTALNDGFFGRAHIFLDFGLPDRPGPTNFGDLDVKEELAMPVGNGRDTLSQAKCSPELPLKRIIAVEPTWAYPANYDASNPLSEDWYYPVTWYVQQNEVHRERFLTFVARPVPDMLKPAYAFGGLSLTQMARPVVDNWLRTRRSVGDIISSFSVYVLLTNMNQQLSAKGEEWLADRAMGFNSTRDNAGLLIIDKEQEDFKNISAPLSTLDVLQAQSQEHMCSLSRIPIVKLLGVQPAGLNADSEGVIRVFYDTISALQERFFRPNLKTIFWFVQLSLWGEVDDDIVFSFEPLWELDELQKATKRKTDADTDNILITAGVIDPQEARQRIADDPDQPYQNLDPEELPELPEPDPMAMGGGFGAPGGGPPSPPGAAPKPGAPSGGPPKPPQKPPPAKGE
jgi:hypothetical protein